MESIINFITDNFVLIFLAIIFLSGLKRAKKKKGPPVNQEIPGNQEHELSVEAESSPPIEDLPLPEGLKKLVKEAEEKPFRQKNTPSREKTAPASRPQPMAREEYSQGHFDNPWSGEGKDNPHEEVMPANRIEPIYGSNGKVFPRNEVRSKSKPSYVMDLPKKAEVKTKVEEFKRVAEEQNAYTLYRPDLMAQMNRRRLADAVIMKEILDKPKALRHKV